MKKSLKNWTTIVCSLVGVIFLSLNTACQVGGGNAPANGGSGISKEVQSNPDILTEGDRILITYAGIPQPPIPHAEQIRQDGTVQPPLLTAPVKAAGLTTGQFRQKLINLYVPGIFTTISLTVRAEERYFTVDGEVNVPGLYPYVGTMTVLKGIASARGLNDFAKKSRILLTRVNGETLIFNYNKARENPEFDMPLYPGDIINAPRRRY